MVVVVEVVVSGDLQSPGQFNELSDLDSQIPFPHLAVHIPI
jgi:hypothetical protein